MNQKRLGSTDLYVNPAGLGCMGLSHAYGDAVSHDEAIEFLKKSFKTSLILQKSMLEKLLTENKQQ